MVPSGTLTVRLVGLAAVTAACVAPKNTTFWLAVALKPVPAMVTLVPIGPLVGVKLPMVWASPGKASSKASSRKPLNEAKRAT